MTHQLNRSGRQRSRSARTESDHHRGQQADIRPHLTVNQLATRWQKHPDFIRRVILGQPAPDGIPEAFRVGSGPKAPWLIPIAAVEAYELRHRACYDTPQGIVQGAA